MAATPPRVVSSGSPAAPAPQGGGASRRLPFSGRPALRIVPDEAREAEPGVSAGPAAATTETAARTKPFGDAGVLAPTGAYARRWKRVFDVAMVVALAPIALTVVALLLAWVRLDRRSGAGSPLYGQTRLGQGGRLFTCWKIRTMTEGADAALGRHLADDPAAAEEWARRQKLARDPRVTPVGRFLRASSLDELPQLWNVLRGEMSVVGPRPFTPEQRRMHPCPQVYESMRPGMTGLWQIGPRGAGADFVSRGAADVRYRREVSLAFDLSILIRTVGVMVEASGE